MLDNLVYVTIYYIYPQLEILTEFITIIHPKEKFL